MRGSRLLSTLAWVQLLPAVFAGATSALLAEDHLDIGPGRFGWLLAAIGIGAGFGPLVLGRLVDDVRRPWFLFGPYLLRGLVDFVLAAFSSFGVALGALAAYGVGTSVRNVTYQSNPPGARARTGYEAGSSPSTTSSGSPLASRASPAAGCSPAAPVSAPSTPWAAYSSSLRELSASLESEKSQPFMTADATTAW